MTNPSSTSVFAGLVRLLRYRKLAKKYGLGELLLSLELSGIAKFGVRLLLGGKPNIDLPRARRIRQCLQELGPVFVKLGQALSTRPDLLPADIVEELTKLQDQVPPFSSEEALNIIQQQYGNQTNSIFKEIDLEPLASASVAQVHCATLQSGLALEGKNGIYSDQVVIKLLRPNVKAAVTKDLNLLSILASSLDKTWNRAEQFQPKKVAAEFESTLLGELDLRVEAANCSQMAANFTDNDIIYVPTVYWDYTHKQIMVMERIFGTSVRDTATLIEKEIDLKKLASDGVTTFFKQAFEDNFFHADMHPGNIFVSDQGRWIAVDFGIMGTLTDQDKRYLATMLLGFFNRDYHAIALAHQCAGWIPRETQLAEFEAAIRMVCEPNFAKPIAEISFGRVLMELFQTVQRFQMPVQPQLVLLYKTLLQIEGLGRQLYPQLNLWDTAKPFLENWMKDQLSPKALLSGIKRDWLHWQGVIETLPNHLHQVMNQKAASTSSDTSSETNIQARELRRSVFNTGLGIAIATLAATILILANITSFSINHYAQASLALISGLGFLWAFKQSR